MSQTSEQIAAQISSAAGNRRAWHNVVYNVKDPVYGAKGDGKADDTEAIQKAIDACNKDGGGIVYAPPGDYKLSNVNPRWALSVSSNVQLIGSGYGTNFFLDPTITPSVLVFMCIMIGTDEEKADNVVISGIRLNGNQVAIGGGFGSITKIILGIGSRLDKNVSAYLRYCSNIEVSDCYIEDVNIGVFSTKNTDINHSTTERLAAQHRNWKVVRNTVKRTTNKAIEFQETMYSTIEDNFIENCIDGPQAINSCRRITISNNRGTYLHTGINVTHNSRNIIVKGNHMVCNSSTLGKAGLIFRTENYEDSSLIRDVVIEGNTFVDEATTNPTAMIFETRVENVSAQFLGITISNNVFSGKVYMYDRSLLRKAEIRDVSLNGNIFNNIVETIANSSDNVTKVYMTGGNVFVSPFTLRAMNWFVTGNIFKQQVILHADSKDNVLNGNQMHSLFTDNGTNNVGQNDILGMMIDFESGSPTSSATNPTHVSFAKPFATPPKVVATAQVGGSGRDVTVLNVTTTGFDLYTFNGGAASSMAVNWIAVGQR